ncbi:gamma-glutamyl phosphate reductase [Shewanella sediminis HAW-EB3]|uniref:Gamma-glutamyl phosphate reductase n=1 Tax=Shewanella sediminis (strain HAW-EB3) TaxID=425104 RepID=PROA_SHESH|nr:glutamate-5-semialdehyde dehydrogenase [Shewanella sediminis]A8FYU6.1 RecName: Full=Gamma-glutamyl phosphate reductase; Short=GPR; AltName: Full=Glutamate-5-semialdehyde dehydrogenase; AltName: Full=Glutamyl-gamma-semialdehyde dehydrogenase; Short=GSA dehydrogenase [Shewanella sediminis HAW-EB3]ABV38019.1 gamma-glutamyl phosphate reductase [Shewanella sediminis HAW-EB3]
MIENNAAYLQTLGQQAKQASYALAGLTGQQKQALLSAIAGSLTKNSATILAANAKDVVAARSNGLNDAMIDRLLLDESRLQGVIGDIDNVINLTDPVGTELESQVLDNGLRLSRRRVPLGVIGVIYEARPNVTVDIAVLALKTGNAVILRGGKETLQSNLALSEAIRAAVVEQGLPADSVQLIQSPDRALVSGLLKLDQFVDMIVPRGGQNLQRLCAEQATIPVILGGIGICHLYADKDADIAKSIAVIANAKVQRPTVCNALDTVLVHEAIADQLLPQLYTHLAASGVTFYGCQSAQAIADKLGVAISIATEETYGQEWLSLTLGVKVVSDIDTAIDHIRTYSSGHSEGILTDSIHASAHFVNEVDSAAVYVNASTRFTDGGQFGLGAEVAVSTQKLHARGPMGLEALTTYKWIGVGEYTARS